jgi:large subunit ribosomal protein L25
MSTRPALAAAHRDVTGKAVARLRRDGQLPAVVFGHGLESQSVSIDAHEFDQLRRHAGPNTLIDLSVDGKHARPALVHGVQVHPLSRRPVHVDLFVVRMTEELTVDVPLIPSGVSPAVELHGGTLLQVMDTIRVRALPDHLPQQIELPVDRLVDFDAVLKVSDLAVPSGVLLVTDVDEVVAKVAPPRIEAVPEVPEEEAATEAGEEAGAAATAASGEGDEEA